MSGDESIQSNRSSGDTEVQQHAEEAGKRKNDGSKEVHDTSDLTRLLAICRRSRHTGTGWSGRQRGLINETVQLGERRDDVATVVHQSDVDPAIS